MNRFKFSLDYLVDRMVKISCGECVTQWGVSEESAHKNGTYGDVYVYKK